MFPFGFSSDYSRWKLAIGDRHRFSTEVFPQPLTSTHHERGEERKKQNRGNIFQGQKGSQLKVRSLWCSIQEFRTIQASWCWHRTFNILCCASLAGCSFFSLLSFSGFTGEPLSRLLPRPVSFSPRCGGAKRSCRALTPRECYSRIPPSSIARLNVEPRAAFRIDH